MATVTNAVHVPLEEYLATTYRPDRDWIDGELRERHMGEMPHSTLQGFLQWQFRSHAKEWSIRALPEQRVQTSAEHYRVPDLAIVHLRAPFELIVRTPPILCIEVLSQGDGLSEVHELVEDYLGMGVEVVWVVDPRRRRAYATDGSGALRLEADELRVPGTLIAVSVAEMFAELDEAMAVGGA